MWFLLTFSLICVSHWIRIQKAEFLSLLCYLQEKTLQEKREESEKAEAKVVDGIVVMSGAVVLAVCI